MTDLAKPNGLASAVDLGGSSPRAALVASDGETAVFASRPHRMGGGGRHRRYDPGKPCHRDHD